MNLRQRLLLMFSLTVIVAVGAVAWVVSLRTREVFAETDKERTSGLVSQFHHEFDRRGAEVKQKLDRMSGSEEVTRVAFDLGRAGDASSYLEEAGSLSREYGLNFLELLDSEGNIISSAQWPARFGYKEQLPGRNGNAFLKDEVLPQGHAMGLFAAKQIRSGDSVVFLVGGERLDREFLQTLAIPAGTQAMLFSVSDDGLHPKDLLALNEAVAPAEKFQALIELALRRQEEVRDIVAPTSDRKDTLFTAAIPLKDPAGKVMAVLLIGSPRRELIALQDHIRVVALAVSALGILFAIAVSLWLTGRVTRPLTELATASQQVAAGDLHVQVRPEHASGEVAELAESFNRMTAQLVEQRERLVQSERVAAWRELARRLAHELKNPLFPLQLTVENLARARHMPQQEFDEIFEESTATLMAEIQNLKTIIGRFSDFSKMPQPHLQAVKLNEIVQRVASLHEPALKSREHPVRLQLAMDPSDPVIAVDPELLHRALSNLVLNAMDGMPEGGTASITTALRGEDARIEVADTGTGLTKEECERLFTPYYTTKEHGTGLGLAIVQSVIADHGGTICVESTPGQGTTFIIDLPRRSAAGAKA